jgi:hypothetical protein
VKLTSILVAVAKLVVRPPTTQYKIDATTNPPPASHSTPSFFSSTVERTLTQAKCHKASKDHHHGMYGHGRESRQTRVSLWRKKKTNCTNASKRGAALPRDRQSVFEWSAFFFFLFPDGLTLDWSLIFSFFVRCCLFLSVCLFVVLKFAAVRSL